MAVLGSRGSDGGHPHTTSCLSAHLNGVTAGPRGSPRDRCKMAQEQCVPSGGLLSPPRPCAKSGTSEAKFNLPWVGRNPEIFPARFCQLITRHPAFEIYLNQNIFDV